MSSGVLICRHADAVLEGADLPDEHRYLSRVGRAQARALAAEIAAAGLAIGEVVTSPLVRAVQTAEGIVHGLGLDLEVEASDVLAPAGSVRLAAERLAEADGLVLVVGHEPSVSALAGKLLGRAGFPALRKAEACLIEGETLVRWFGSDRR